MGEQALVTISEASRLLGVSEAALRQWTDEGKIKAFITPGGHRRYSRAELRKFMTSHQKVLGMKDLVVELEDTVQLHREIARTYPNTATWYDQLGQEAQEHLAELGRRFLNLIIRYITEPSRREETIKLARQIGCSYGETLAKQGLPLTDSVAAFMRHREPIMEATTQLMRKKEPFNGRIVAAIPQVTQVMDETLLSLVDAHQQYQGVLSGKPEGGGA